MAAAAAPEDDEPFSPSDFLDLPPTPSRPDGDGDGDVPALRLDLEEDHHHDHVVLPFITRVLMEDDEEDGIHDDDDGPDHHALLEAAQQPFAEILSHAAAAASSSAKSSTAAWPYDPVEFSQLLLLRSGTTATSPGPGQHGSSGDGGEDDDSNRVTMDMLNQAFLKGMEEANKFLPTTTNSSLITMVLQEERSPNGMKGRKNCRHINWWDKLEDDDDETSRNCKLMMVPETDEQIVDEFVLNGYQSLLEKMMDMSLTMKDRPPEKNKTGKGKGQRSTDDEVVDLRTLLIHCAQAVATGNRRHAVELLTNIKQRSSPSGDATQRLAHCFAQGLEARLAGTGSHVYNSLVSARRRTSPAVEFHKAYQLYMAVCCFQLMAFKFSNITICKAIKGRKKVHIVDYGEQYGFQWPTLLGFLATWEGGPPEVKITAIDLPQPGFRPAARVDQTGRRLSSFARRCGVPFKFHSIVAKWETVGVDDLDIEPDEVLVVNGLFHFGKLLDEGADIDSPSPRDMVLGNIRKMRPDVFILCTVNSSHNAPFFLTRFREALFYYSAMFDMMDATAPRDNDERVLVEQEIFGRSVLNVIACEGMDRVERPEAYRQWQIRNDRAGMRQLPLELDIVKAISNKVKDGYHKDFVVDVDQQWLLQGWKGRILNAMSTWVAKDATS